MGLYIGVKMIKALCMNKEQYCKVRGWSVPENEDPVEEGYLVEYLEGGKPNHKDFDGYISWSPKDVFEKSYRAVGGMNFGLALEAAKLGKKIARSGWNGTDQFVVAMPPLWLPPYNTQEPGPKVNDRTAKYIGVDAPLDCQPYFALYNAQKKWVPGWIPSQGDLFADDWMIID